MNNKTFWFVIVICTLVEILCIAGLCYADETMVENYDPGKPASVALGLLVAPLSVQGSDLTYGHALELEGWAGCATFIGYEILPKKAKFMSPIFVEIICVLWRTGELGQGNDNLAWRKLGADSFGVLSTAIIKF